MSERWLQCSIEKGMFSGEFVVKPDAFHSFFVPRDHVRGSIGERGQVKVRVLSRDSNLWAMMPTEDMAMIQVRPEQLV